MKEQATFVSIMLTLLIITASYGIAAADENTIIVDLTQQIRTGMAHMKDLQKEKSDKGKQYMEEMQKLANQINQTSDSNEQIPLMKRLLNTCAMRLRDFGYYTDQLEKELFKVINNMESLQHTMGETQGRTSSPIYMDDKKFLAEYMGGLSTLVATFGNNDPVRNQLAMTLKVRDAEYRKFFADGHKYSVQEDINILMDMAGTLRAAKNYLEMDRQDLLNKTFSLVNTELASSINDWTKSFSDFFIVDFKAGEPMIDRAFNRVINTSAKQNHATTQTIDLNDIGKGY